jgi:hypothetical protein
VLLLAAATIDRAVSLNDITAGASAPIYSANLPPNLFTEKING